MKYPVLLGVSRTVLVACSLGDRESGPANFVPTPARFADTGEVDTLPEGEQRYTGSVESMAYDPDTERLLILGDPFDLAGIFVRTPDKDVRGFAAFQNEGGARRYTALVRTDTVNQLAAGVVGTPFRLDNQFGGTVLAREAAPELPSNREIRHVGEYAAVRNVGANDGADMSNSFLHRVEGQVQLDLDFFSDGPTPGIEGVITNRRNMDGTVLRDAEFEITDSDCVTRTETRQFVTEITYDDIVLRFTEIDDEGNFRGEAAVGGQALGEFDGMITGSDAAVQPGWC